MTKSVFIVVPLLNPTGAFVSQKGFKVQLTDPHIASRLRSEIDTFSIQTWEKGPRAHMGASEIGKPCHRHLWFKFRLCDYKEYTGRMHRLFRRGHEEEPRVISHLEGIGCKFLKLPEFFNERTGQHAFHSVMGHYAGSCDGIMTLPAWCEYSGNVLWENKTYGGEVDDKKDFSKLLQVGVQAVKYEHWAQMQVYMWKFGLEYALYTAVQKSTDEVYVEIIPAIDGIGESLERKAQAIITHDSAPSKISTKGSADYRCRFCDMKEICHLGKETLTNCRSCKNAKPVDNGGWECSLYGAIPQEGLGLHVDCGSWQPIFKG